MSTRASIVLKLKDEDIGKKMKFEPSRLPLGITCDMAGVDKVEWVELSKRYIMIYHNYDSYPSGMGVYLYYIYNDYDKIINLLLGGNVSSILGTMLMQYICYPDGVWADEKPIVYDEMPEKEEDWNFHNSYSGTPQGGIVSPILANIYLDKLDKFMKEYTEKFDKGKERKRTKQVVSLEGKRHRILKKLKVVKDKSERSELIRQYKAYQKEGLQYSDGDEMDMNYRKLKYVRYADDFLIGIIGSKQDAIIIKEDIKNFLYEKLALTLSDEKTLITHAENAAKFLGYEIFVRKSNDTKRSKYGVLRRVFNKRIQLALGKDTFKKKLLEYRVLEIKIHNGKEYWKAKSRPKLSNNNDFEILDRYNKEIKGIYNYYCLANNCSSLSKLGYIMKYSMYKTFAQKYRTTMSQIRKKYTKNGLFSVRYYLKNGTTKDLTFYHGGFKKKNPMNIKDLDNLPKFTYHPTNTSLIDRLKAEKCELCGAVDKLVMHHVRKLKNLQGKTTCEKQMMARKRKTIAICGKCYKKLSNNG